MLLQSFVHKMKKIFPGKFRFMQSFPTKAPRNLWDIKISVMLHKLKGSHSNNFTHWLFRKLMGSTRWRAQYSEGLTCWTADASIWSHTSLHTECFVRWMVQTLIGLHVKWFKRWIVHTSWGTHVIEFTRWVITALSDSLGDFLTRQEFACWIIHALKGTNGEKVRYHNFFFIRTQNYNYLTFRFPGRCSKVLNLLWTLGMSNNGYIFLAI